MAHKTIGQKSFADYVVSQNVKRSNPHTYGYKAHIGIDEGTDIVREAHITSADFHDSKLFYHCISEDEESVCADKAYDSKVHRAELKKHGVNPRILYKAHRNTPLTKLQKLLNKLYSKRRAGVEKIFGTWKRLYGYKRSRLG